jgi:hypothetical protein
MKIDLNEKIHHKKLDKPLLKQKSAIIDSTSLQSLDKRKRRFSLDFPSQHLIPSNHHTSTTKKNRTHKSKADKKETKQKVRIEIV